ncbi:diaminopimelate dehydrogenase [Paramicrobacterium agarici]|uniref:diaminopimelate dehydrogenase n=1 Tax=Paramicrobacterium agarici TaxID=630514 RepID=UPI0011541FE7|nr:diaminopimelate dehydrogenase [Microbacterium agarici]
MNTTPSAASPASASTPIRVGIVGYGNLGRGVEAAIAKNPDMSLAGIFTRRPSASITPIDPSASVFTIDALTEHENDIDVLILCGGSKTDLPVQGPELAARFNTVDSFDTHARIPEYFETVDAATRRAQTTALISTGWDPGMFSLNRLFGEALLPDGDTYTFWGRGLSQGHSDAVRRVDGVADAVQYTLPSQKAVDAVRSGTRPVLTTRQKHTRECFVVLEEGADADAVREAIVTMPHYFADYDTTVTFITADELARDHSAMPHGGFVLRSGLTGQDHAQIIEYSLALESNPEFTASVLVAYARAVHRLSQQNQHGAFTVLDVPPGLLSPKSPAQLRAELL